MKHKTSFKHNPTQKQEIVILIGNIKFHNLRSIAELGKLTMSISLPFRRLRLEYHKFKANLSYKMRVLFDMTITPRCLRKVTDLKSMIGNTIQALKIFIITKKKAIKDYSSQVKRICLSVRRGTPWTKEKQLFNMDYERH